MKRCRGKYTYLSEANIDCQMDPGEERGSEASQPPVWPTIMAAKWPKIPSSLFLASLYVVNFKLFC
jgi:hypothetical protein